MNNPDETPAHNDCDCSQAAASLGVSLCGDCCACGHEIDEAPVKHCYAGYSDCDNFDYVGCRHPSKIDSIRLSDFQDSTPRQPVKEPSEAAIIAVALTKVTDIYIHHKRSDGSTEVSIGNGYDGFEVRVSRTEALAEQERMDAEATCKDYLQVEVTPEILAIAAKAAREYFDSIEGKDHRGDDVHFRELAEHVLEAPLKARKAAKS